MVLKRFYLTVCNFTDRMPARPKSEGGAHFDMRPITGQAVGTFGLLPSTILLISLVASHSGSSWSVGLRVGALVGFLSATIGWIQSWRFERRMVEGSNDFWETHHRRSLRRAWLGSLLMVLLMSSGLLASAVLSNELLAGICTAGAFFPVFVIFGYIDKVRTTERR